MVAAHLSSKVKLVNKRFAWPKGHWDWPIKVSHKHGVRCGQMFWVGGQADLTGDGVVCNPGDLAAQVPNCITNFSRILQELGSDLADLVKLLCFMRTMEAWTNTASYPWWLKLFLLRPDRR